MGTTTTTPVSTQPAAVEKDPYADMPDLIDEGSSDEPSSDSDLPPLLNPDEVSDEEDDENDFPPNPKAAFGAKKSTTGSPSPLYVDTKAVEVVEIHAKYSRAAQVQRGSVG